MNGQKRTTPGPNQKFTEDQKAELNALIASMTSSGSTLTKVAETWNETHGEEFAVSYRTVARYAQRLREATLRAAMDTIGEEIDAARGVLTGIIKSDKSKDRDRVSAINVLLKYNVGGESAQTRAQNSIALALLEDHGDWAGLREVGADRPPVTVVMERLPLLARKIAGIDDEEDEQAADL